MRTWCIRQGVSVLKVACKHYTFTLRGETVIDWDKKCSVTISFIQKKKKKIEQKKISLS